MAQHTEPARGASRSGQSSGESVGVSGRESTNTPARPSSHSPDTGRSPGAGHYQERLAAPWWMWLLVLALATGAAAETGLGAPGLRTWVPYAVLLPAGVALLLWISRLRVGVVGGELRVDDARLEVRYVAQVGVLDTAATRAALGPDSDPYAFVVQRPWVRQSVLVVLADPADPTPYWLVSARRPHRLAAALLAAGAGRVSAAAGDGKDQP